MYAECVMIDLLVALRAFPMQFKLLGSVNVPSQLMKRGGRRQSVRLIRSLKLAHVPLVVIYAMLLISFNAKLDLKQESPVLCVVCLDVLV